jgi:hypothetical protein
LKKFLEELNIKVNEAGGKLSEKQITQYKTLYRNILKAADKEYPENKKQRAQSKSRNSLND